MRELILAARMRRLVSIRPGGTALRRGKARTIALWLVVTIGVGTGASSMISCSAEEVETDDRPREVDFDGYVSSDRCQSCHPREYATWRASYHRTMTQVVTPETVLGDFDDVELEHEGISYRLFRRGDAYWAEWDNPRWKRWSRAPRRIKRELVLMTGSHHDQMYWHTTPGRGQALVLFAFDYSLRMKRWIPTMSSFLVPPGEPHNRSAGYWNLVCSQCHTVHPETRVEDWKPDARSAHMATRVVEFGVGCEACHGPGGKHVEQNHDPVQRYREHLLADSDLEIVQPKELDSRRSAAVCGQCHGIWVHQKEGDGFKPGMNMDEQRVYFQARYADPDFRPTSDLDRERQRAVLAEIEKNPLYMQYTHWSDGVLRVSGREYNGLLDSQCFERGELSCLSCHTMHPSNDDPRPLKEWANDQLAHDMLGNQACVGCHPQFAAPEESESTALTAHTHHAPESTGSLCYNCHMPFSVYGIQKAHRSHTIAVPSVAESLNTGRPNACNQCHLDETLAWSAEALSAWYGTPEPALTPEQESTAAAVLWSLKGDAGQRALMAWSMGWASAREASGAEDEQDWMVPYLAQLLDDPYDSVRFMAILSLQKRKAFESLDYDFLGPRKQRRATSLALRGRNTFTHSRTGDGGSRVLLDGEGRLRTREFDRLVGLRNDTRLILQE